MKTHKEQYLLKVIAADLDLLRYYLRLIRFKTEPLIEQVNQDLYDCVVTTHNMKEQFAAQSLWHVFERRRSLSLYEVQTRHRADCQDHRRKYGDAVCHCDEDAR